MIPIKNASRDINKAESPRKQTTKLSALAIGLRLMTTAAPKTSITIAKSQKRKEGIKLSGVMEYWVKGKRARDSQYSNTPLLQCLVTSFRSTSKRRRASRRQSRAACPCYAPFPHE